jgi:hypothetical protein
MAPTSVLCTENSIGEKSGFIGRIVQSKVFASAEIKSWNSIVGVE